MCLQGGWLLLAWNDVAVGNTGQSLEVKTHLIIARYFDEEALRRCAKLRESPQALLPKVRRQRYRNCA